MGVSELTTTPHETTLSARVQSYTELSLPLFLHSFQNDLSQHFFS